MATADLAVRFAQTFDVCIFATSLVAKGRRRASIDAFTGAVTQLVPRAPARLTVAAVLAGELTVVLMLLVGAVATGLGLALLMVAAFSTTIAAAIRDRRRVACQCFGPSSSPVSFVHLVRNGVILAVTCAGLTCVPFTTAASGLLEPAALGVSAVAVVAAVCTVVADRFSDLFVLNPKEQ